MPIQIYIVNAVVIIGRSVAIIRSRSNRIETMTGELHDPIPRQFCDETRGCPVGELELRQIIINDQLISSKLSTYIKQTPVV